MDDLFITAGTAPSGYRLDKLELFNWGTFDSSQGNVHTVRPGGATTLLIGQNASGKSTLVDAVLTLLVRPAVRNYNVAAGAHKQERDERSYVKGAYGRFSRDDDNRADVHYLRPDGRHYSAILACFRNDRGDAFTVAQVLYINADGIEKVYCLAQGEKSIAEDCAHLTGTGRVRQQMEQRGFRATTSYTEYFNWFVRVTGVKPKAMDMFNQTVAVKDIQSLNKFIREHMLEAKPWHEKIDNLQSHFAQLSEAHQNLIRVRRQFDLLQPVVDKGTVFSEHSVALDGAERLLAGADSFFRQQTIDLFEPACMAQAEELEQLANQKRRQAEDLRQRRESIRQLTNEIEQAGGDRLKQLPMLISQQAAQAEVKLAAWRRLRAAVTQLGLRDSVGDADTLARIHHQMPDIVATLKRQAEGLEKDREAHIVARAALIRQREDDRQELHALEQRQGNLPEWLASVRRRLCEDLRLPEKDLPFVAELVAVRPDQREWQASIEMVLRGFALSLLVPLRHYGVVAAHIDRTRLTDARGQGQRLIYLRVGERAASARNAPIVRSESLLRKVDLREGHALMPWVKAELEDRFDVRCCNTVEEFQATQDLAMTRQRHIRWRGERHEKDDRERTADPRNYVLGWDNREKRRHLSAEIERVGAQIAHLDAAIERCQDLLTQIRGRELAVEQVKQVTQFADIDFAFHEREKAALENEKRSLEDNNDVIRVLRCRVKEIEHSCEQLEAAREETIRAEQRAERDLQDGRRLIDTARITLRQRESNGVLPVHLAVFPDIVRSLEGATLTTDNVFELERHFKDSRSGDITRLRQEVDRAQQDVTAAMNHYLRQFPDEQADLDGRVEYLDSFLALHEQIRRDDLPRHETRFKERLNEKVIQEIGLLNGAFQSERTEIVSKIDMLNESLRQLEYRPGSFMRLEPRQVRDREILEFQDSLRQCLAGTFEGTLEADEARYLRIERFLSRLRDETRWCEKVTDVRRWFDFAARELDAHTAQEKAYYEDSTGQSGGEKAKLAFTILVAAIAYQYDIDPARPGSDRFRFVVVDEMFSKVDDQYSEYALELFRQFGLQLLIVAPLDAKARVTEPHVGCYLHVMKDAQTNCSEVLSMTAREFEDAVITPGIAATTAEMNA